MPTDLLIKTISEGAVIAAIALFAMWINWKTTLEWAKERESIRQERACEREQFLSIIRASLSDIPNLSTSLDKINNKLDRLADTWLEERIRHKDS